MTERALLIQEIDSLPPQLYGEVIDFVGYIKARKAKQTVSLENAVAMAAEEYRCDEELTAFCALDSEDFYETR